MRYPQPAYWRVQLLEVHDGDTITVLVDKGGPQETREIWHLRLKDVFAPELSQPGGLESKGNLIKLLNQAPKDSSEWPFMIQTFRTPKSDVDLITLSRFVATIWGLDLITINTLQQNWITSMGYGGGIGS